MKRSVQCVVGCVLLASPLCVVAQKNDPTLKNYLKSKQMVHVPEIDQNRPSPGSLIVVQYQPGILGKKMLQPDFLWPKKGLPAPKEDSITLPQEVVISSLKVSGGASIYGVDVSGMFNHSKDINYKPEDAPTAEFADDLDDLLDPAAKTATLQQVLKYTMQSNDGTPTHPAFSTKYDLYLVEAVYRGGDLDISSTSATGLSLLQGKSANTQCTAPTVPSDSGNAQTNGAGSPVGGANPGAGTGTTGNAAASATTPKASPASGETTADAKVASGAHVDVCHVSGGLYKLVHTPPVAFGIKVKHIYWDYDDKRLETEPVDTNRLSFDM